MNSSDRVNRCIEHARRLFHEWQYADAADLSRRLERPLDLNLVGWLHLLLEHRARRTRVLLQKRVDLYRAVAKEEGCAGMLAEPHLEVLKDQLNRTLDSAIQGFSGHVERMFSSAGTAPQVSEKDVDNHFRIICVGTINSGIASLESEGLLRSTENDHQRSPLPPPQTTARGRGFPANADEHRKIVKAVQSLGSKWQSLLPELCIQVDSEKADLPKWAVEEHIRSWKGMARALKGSKSSRVREKLAGWVRYRLKWIERNRPH
jgi:hypothetical protein